MANKILVLAVVLFVVFGCGVMDRVRQSGESNTAANSAANKTLTDKAVDTAVGEQKVGIAECDEALDILSEQANNPDDNFVTKAVKKTTLTTFRDQVKKSLEKNASNTKDVAKFCKDFRDNLGDSSVEGNTNSK